MSTLPDWNVTVSEAVGPDTVLVLAKRAGHAATVIEQAGTFRVKCIPCGFATGPTSEIEAFATATAHNHTGVKIVVTPPQTSATEADGPTNVPA